MSLRPASGPHGTVGRFCEQADIGDVTADAKAEARRVSCSAIGDAGTGRMTVTSRAAAPAWYEPRSRCPQAARGQTPAATARRKVTKTTLRSRLALGGFEPLTTRSRFVKPPRPSNKAANPANPGPRRVQRDKHSLWRGAGHEKCETRWLFYSRASGSR